MQTHRFLYFLAIGLCLIWFGCGNDDDDGDNDDNRNTIMGKDNAPMVLIPASEFEMGDSKNEPESSMERSRPVHTVSLDAFYMDVYEVTNARYATFLNEMGKHQGDNGQKWLDIGDGEELIELVGGQYLNSINPLDSRMALR